MFMILFAGTEPQKISSRIKFCGSAFQMDFLMGNFRTFTYVSADQYFRAVRCDFFKAYFVFKRSQIHIFKQVKDMDWPFCIGTDVGLAVCKVEQINNRLFIIDPCPSDRIAEQRAFPPKAGSDPRFCISDRRCLSRSANRDTLPECSRSAVFHRNFSKNQ